MRDSVHRQTCCVTPLLLPLKEWRAAQYESLKEKFIPNLENEQYPKLQKFTNMNPNP